MYGFFMKRLLLALVLLPCFFAGTAMAQIPGYRYAPRVPSWRIGLEGGVSVLGGDLTSESQHYHFRPVGGVELAWVLHRNFAIGLYGGGGTLRSTATDTESNAVFYDGGVLFELRLPTFRGSLFPLLQARAGGIVVEPELRMGDEAFDASSSKHMAYTLAAGLEAISWRQLGMRVLVGVTYTTTDRLDLLLRGDDNDAYSFAVLSLHYYIHGRR